MSTVGPFETVVEGPLDRLLEIAAAAHKALLKAGAPTAATYEKLWSGEGIGTEKRGEGRQVPGFGTLIPKRTDSKRFH
ncbi:MAG: thiamine-binding protein [Candidatus Moduliflexus flocculans]|nr:thiamine-binding protein [Candidatus Moduliflexus flocculans]